MDPLPLKTRPPKKPVSVTAVQPITPTVITDGQELQPTTTPTPDNIQNLPNSAPENEFIDVVLRNSNADQLTSPQSPTNCDENAEATDEDQHPSVRQRSASFIKNIFKRTNSLKRSKSQESQPAENSIEITNTTQDSPSVAHTKPVTVDKHVDLKQRGTTFLKNILPKKTECKSVEISLDVQDFVDHDEANIEEDSSPNKITVKKRSAAFLKKLLPKKSDNTNNVFESDDDNDLQSSKDNQSRLSFSDQSTEKDRKEDEDEASKESNTIKQSSSKSRKGLFQNIIDRSQLFSSSEETNYFVREETVKTPSNQLEHPNEDEQTDEKGNSNENESKITNNLKQRSTALVKNILNKSNFTKKNKTSDVILSDEPNEGLTSNIITPEDNGTISESIVSISEPESNLLIENENQEHKRENQCSADFVKNILESNNAEESTANPTTTATNDIIEDSCKLENTPNVKQRSATFLKNILDRNHTKKHLEENLQINETKEAIDVNTTEPELPSLQSQTKKPKCCHPIVEKLKTMADKQYNKGKMNIRKLTIKSDEKLDLDEHQTILNLKESPRAERSKGFASYVVKHQDSDDVLEIVEMDESPSEVRRRRDQEHAERLVTVLVPDEIIELPIQSPNHQEESSDAISIEPTVNEILEEEFKTTAPNKAPRKSKEHYYEDIDIDDDNDPMISDFAAQLRREDETFARQMLETSSSVLRPLDSVESADSDTINVIEETTTKATLAPMSSIDSNSSDEERIRNRLSVLSEDPSLDVVLEIVENNDLELSGRKSNLKREVSPGLEKKVTFSSSTEAVESEEDHEIEHEKMDGRWSNMRYVDLLF